MFWIITFTIVQTILTEDLLEISDALTSKAKSISTDSTWTLPQYDGIRRMVKIQNLKELDLMRRENKIVVVLYTTPLMTGDEISVKNWRINAYMLEMTAQLLVDQKAVIGYVDMLADHHIAKRESVSEDGVVLVYRRGKRLTFYGHRSPQVLMQFLVQACSSPVREITNKVQRQQFEELDIPKVVGYFRDKNDRGYQVFETVAENFHPNIPSYTVYDSKIAKHLKLKSVGDIHMHKPYERPPKSIHLNHSMSSEDIISFVEHHKKPILRQLTLQDVHSTWSHNSRSQIVLSFVQPSSPSGHQFFRLLKRLALQYQGDHNYSFLFINPQNFPSMVPYWIKTYRIDLDQPQIGLVNLTDNRSTWFDGRLFRDHNESRDMGVLQQWLNSSYLGQPAHPHTEDYEIRQSTLDTLNNQQSTMSSTITKPKDEF